MKNALLILLMLLLPLQAIAAAERNFTHVVNNKQGQAYFIKHFSEHVALVMHHHDDDGGESHDDNPQQSSRHLADVDQGVGVNALLPAPQAVVVLPMIRVAPAIRPDSFDTRIPLPPRRPPRNLA